MSWPETSEDIRRNLGVIEDKVNSLEGMPVDQALAVSQMLQVHATLALTGAVVLVAEEIAELRAALTEE